MSGDLRAPVVVEFVGLPGAGKTTVADWVAAELSAEGLACGSRLSVSEHEVHPFLHYMRLGLFYLGDLPELHASLKLTRASLAITPARVAQSFRFLSLWAYRLQLLKGRGYHTVLLDQGVVQGAWSLMLRSPWRDEAIGNAVRRIILEAELPYCLVYFDVPVETALDRISHRPSMESSFDHMERSEARRSLQLHKNGLEQLFLRTVQETGIPHLRVDGTRPVAEVSEEVRSMAQAAARRPEPAAVPAT